MKVLHRYALIIANKAQSYHFSEELAIDEGRKMLVGNPADYSMAYVAKIEAVLTRPAPSIVVERLDDPEKPPCNS